MANLFSGKKPVAKKAGQRELQADFEAGMPDAAFVEAKNEYYNSVGQPVVDRARLFVVCVLLLVIVLGLVAAIIRMAPLKTTAPYVILVDEAHGVVAKSAGQVRPAAEYTPDRPVLEREIYSFVDRLYSLNADYPKVVVDGHIAAYAYTRGRATTEFKAFLDAEQPYQRQTKTPGLIRTTEKKTISFREDGKLVLIRFRTNERDSNRTVPISRDWLMTLQFVREQPAEAKELDSNPLGLYITHFEIVEER